MAKEIQVPEADEGECASQQHRVDMQLQEYPDVGVEFVEESKELAEDNEGSVGWSCGPHVEEEHQEKESSGRDQLQCKVQYPPPGRLTIVTLETLDSAGVWGWAIAWLTPTAEKTFPVHLSTHLKVQLLA